MDNVRKIKYGAHVAIDENINFPALEFLSSTGAFVAQVFLHTPYKYFDMGYWTKDRKEAFKDKITTLGMDVYAHTSFFINLASPNHRIWSLSLKSVSEDMKLAEELGIKGVVTHVGSHTKESTLEQGLLKVQQAIKLLLGGSSTPQLLLENGAGKGTAVANDLELMERIINEAQASPSRLGIALDTAHAWGRGLDFRNPESMLNFKNRYGRYIKLVHFNNPDKGVLCGSGRDRHRSTLIDGEIDFNIMKDIAEFFLALGIPMVLERPCDKEEFIDNQVLAADLETLCKLSTLTIKEELCHELGK
jgi:deoxyribonuclease-4